MTMQWFRVLDLNELPEGRVMTVTAGHKSLAMTHYQGQYGALDNRCLHQGGSLGGRNHLERPAALSLAWLGLLSFNRKPPGDLAVDDALATFPGFL